MDAAEREPDFQAMKGLLPEPQACRHMRFWSDGDAMPKTRKPLENQYFQMCHLEARREW